MDRQSELEAKHLCRILRLVDLQGIIQILDASDATELAAIAIGKHVSVARGLSAWLKNNAFTVGQARPLLALADQAINCSAKPQLVWTASVDDDLESLQTAVAVADLISSTQQQLIIAGYRVSEGTLRSYDLDKRSSSIDVIVIADATQLASRDIIDMRRLGVTVCPIKNDRGSSAKFHVKAIVSDERRVLITSANFTELGQHDNIELGVVLHGPIATNIARALFRIIRQVHV